MSNYIEYKDKLAFHPGYYIKELVDASGLTQEDYAKRMGTTPKNLSVLVRGEQRLSIDIAVKLSRMLGTSVAFWLNLQRTFDEKLAEILSDEELAREREVFKLIDYRFFWENFGLPELPGQEDEQIKCLREFLSVSSLTVLEEKDLAVSFCSCRKALDPKHIANANAVLQIAVNRAAKEDGPNYNKKKFSKAVSLVLKSFESHKDSFKEISEAFRDAGVLLIMLPELSDAGIKGASKRVAGKVMLLLCRGENSPADLWFTLFHEVGHILSGELGYAYDSLSEDGADFFAKSTFLSLSR